MTHTLGGQVCVVTGAARGIGRASALRLAAEGALVAVWDADVALGGEICEEIVRAGGRAEAVAVDVASSRSVARAAEATRAALGSPSVLVNNAGVATPGVLWETTDEEWQRTLAVNLSGQFYCARELIGGMIATGGGSIVNVASISALIGRKEASAAYCASKGGVIGLTYLLAAQAGEHNVRVNAVCPGTTLTGIHDAFTGEQLQGLLSTIVLQRPRTDGARNAGYAEDVAEAVLFYASPGSSWVTGTVLPVSGGQLMR